MVKGKVSIVEKGLYKFAVYGWCHAQSKSSLLNQEAAEQEIRQRFETHNCKPMDSSQNALQIVKEATEGK